MTAFEAFMKRIAGWSELTSSQVIKTLIEDNVYLLQHMTEEEEAKAIEIIQQMRTRCR
jgi:hypothetical protein